MKNERPLQGNEIPHTIRLCSARRAKRQKGAFKRLGPTPNGPRPNADKRVPVTITGYIVGAWGNDDGESQEFQVEVTKVTTHDKESE